MRSYSTAAAGRATRWTTLAMIFSAAFLLRMAVPIVWPGIHYPDEIIQSLEQAHRLVFGNGLVPWEFRDGARSWLLPALLAGPMWLGDALKPGTGAYRLLAQALVAALSASSVVVGFMWARKHGIRHAVLAAVVLCTWFELVYFGARALGEVVAAAFLFAGVYLCAEREPRSARHDLLAGVCLAGAFVFRFHLAPALALAALWRCRRDFRARWVPMLLGASIPLLALGIVDGIAWSEPFGSIVNNFRANIVQGRSHVYGTSGAGWYVLQTGRALALRAAGARAAGTVGCPARAAAAAGCGDDRARAQRHRAQGVSVHLSSVAADRVLRGARHGRIAALVPARAGRQCDVPGCAT